MKYNSKNHMDKNFDIKYIGKFGFRLICFSLLCMSCKKLAEVSSPLTSINETNVYNSDATAISVLTGIYSAISTSSFSGGGILSMSLFPGLSADELQLLPGATNSQYFAYYANALGSKTYGFEFWEDFYPIIYTANSAIDGIGNSSSLTPGVKQQLLGEAKFMRAFCYFYLVNLYGDVPLVLTTDYKTNSLLSRTPQAQVWDQIITDLKEAENLLNNNYVDATVLNSTSQRVRPNQWVAAAMLARAYLYTQNFQGADSAASAVIGNTSLYNLDSLNAVFLANSTEAIWQIQPITVGQNTQDAILFILPPSGPSTGLYPVFLNSNLLNVFEAGDERRQEWIDSVNVNGISYYFPYKYKVYVNPSPVSEYEMVLRLSEQYLIRAEAELNGAPGDAIADLNVIRNRAGLPNYVGSTDKLSLEKAILHERQVELFTEWGQRWMDLKRSVSIDSIMAAVTLQKGGVWQNSDSLYPLPLTDLQADPNLVQNPNY